MAFLGDIAKETAAQNQVTGDDPASVAEVAYARYAYHKYLSADEGFMSQQNSFFGNYEDPVTVPQHDGRLSYLKSTMDKDPSTNNVYGLIDELEDRKHVDDVFANIFPEQHAKVSAGEKITKQPRDFKCLRKLNELLDSHCEANGEYALTY